MTSPRYRFPTASAASCAARSIVVRDGHDAPSLAGVVAHCEAQRLARQKIPERLEIVDSLPRNTTGKILKQPLIDRFA